MCIDSVYKKQNKTAIMFIGGVGNGSCGGGAKIKTVSKMDGFQVILN